MVFHARSISLPSRPHPVSLSVEDQLDRLKSGEATFCSSPHQNLYGLKNLYESADSLLQLPFTQQALSRESANISPGHALDSSLMLLDLCGTTRDVISEMKSCVQNLESSLRRRNCREFELGNEIEKYNISRRKMNKMVVKYCRNLKRMHKQDCKLPGITGILGEVEAVSVTVFESLLQFICPTKARSKSLPRSLLLKFIQYNSERVDEDVIRVHKLDAALSPHKSSKGIDVMKLQKDLQSLELTMQELEEVSESVFRILVKIRVSLLNIINF